MDQSLPKLSYLHAALSSSKLALLVCLTNDELRNSLQPGKPGSLKVRPDGTILDGHHRISILRGRGIDVDALPREIIEKHSYDA